MAGIKKLRGGGGDEAAIGTRFRLWWWEVKLCLNQRDDEAPETLDVVGSKALEEADDHGGGCLCGDPSLRNTGSAVHHLSPVFLRWDDEREGFTGSRVGGEDGRLGHSELARW